MRLPHDTTACSRSLLQSLQEHCHGPALDCTLEWKIGSLVQTYFSYAGDDDREDVRMMNIQYFVYYSVTDTMSIGAGPNIIGNFEANTGDKWTFPVGIGINRTFQIGKVPVRIGIEYHYSIVRPESVGAQHDIRFMIIPAAPSALFKWMQ